MTFRMSNIKIKHTHTHMKGNTHLKKPKILTIPRTGRTWSNWNSFLAGGNAKRYSPLWKTFGSLV